MTPNTILGFTYQGVLAIANALIALLVGISVITDDKTAVLILALVNAILMAVFHVDTLSNKRKMAAANIQ